MLQNATNRRRQRWCGIEEKCMGTRGEEKFDFQKCIRLSVLLNFSCVLEKTRFVHFLFAVFVEGT